MPAGIYRRPSLEERFWKKVEKTDGCWLWKAARNSKGYGELWDKDKIKGTHRVSWKLYSGKIPDGMWVLHKCDNPPCVNPNHLFLGTNSDNMKDMYSKGRGAKPYGEAHYLSKLNNEKVTKIRKMYKTGKYVQRELGEIFGVTGGAIWDVVNHKTWAHV